MEIAVAAAAEAPVADPGGHRAADQRRPIERHVAADLHHGMFMHQHLLGKGRKLIELVDGRPTPGKARRLALCALRLVLVVTVEGAARGAMGTVAAKDRQAGDDAVALFHFVALEHIGKAADFAVKLLVGEDALLAGFAFPDDGCFIA